MNSFLSKLEGIKYGVPQGFCLGPLLLLLYINDLNLALKNSKVTMHTDDTSICFSSGSVDDINRALNEDLENLKIWLECKKLSINLLKIQGMFVATSRQLQRLKQESSTKPSFQIGDNEVKLVDNSLYFGVQVDQFLNWK